MRPNGQLSTQWWEQIGADGKSLAEFSLVLYPPGWVTSFHVLVLLLLTCFSTGRPCKLFAGLLFGAAVSDLPFTG